jgi:hypothetical protein
MLLSSRIPTYDFKENATFSGIPLNRASGLQMQAMQPSSFVVPQWAKYSDNGKKIPIMDYEIKRVIDKKTYYANVFYLVQWEGFDVPSWEPIENMTYAQEAIDDYEHRRAEAR